MHAALVAGVALVSLGMGGLPQPTFAPADTPADRAASSRAVPKLEVRRVARGLEYPWDVADLGNGRLLVTERNRARVSVVRKGVRRTVGRLRGSVWVSGETGLMSIALDPGFAETGRLHLCHGGTTASGHDVRVTTWELRQRRLRKVGVLLDGLPATSGRHGGCRLLVADDGALLVGTGDAADASNPRDLDSLGGKVLRLDLATGKPAAGNPFGSDSRARRFVYTYGHRNVQGLAQRRDGSLWSVEHGSNRDDEVNRLVAGGDYGWDPDPGYDESVPMTDHSLPGKQIAAAWRSGFPTLATSGAAWVRGRQWGRLAGTLAVAALKSERLLFIKFDRAGDLRWVRAPRALRRYGRLRSVTAAEDGDLLVTTSNGSRDAVLRVSPR